VTVPVKLKTPCQRRDTRLKLFETTIMTSLNSYREDNGDLHVSEPRRLQGNRTTRVLRQSFET